MFLRPSHTLRTVWACLLSLTVSVAVASDWPQWRGPGRDGKSAETGLIENWDKTPPKHLWTIEGMGEGFAAPSISKGFLYVTGNVDGGQAVIKVKLADHSTAWTKVVTEGKPKHGYEGSRCTPSVDGDLLYVVTSDGRISCLKSGNGDVVWSHPFSKWEGKMQNGWGYSESPLVDGDLVLCTPGGEKATCRVRKVPHMWPEDDRCAVGGGFDHVLPAAFAVEAAADERDGGEGVQRVQLADGIDQDDGRGFAFLDLHGGR